ncbi:MAG: alpha/beta fold hydrolase [Halobacteriaceae archaeon]
MLRVEHDGRETAYEHTAGAGPTLCCVHGSGATKAIWKAQRARLSYDVAALDLAGHGDSPDVDTSAGPATLSAYVDDLAAVVAALEADVVVGNSLGGAVIIQALLDEAIDVDRAVLIGSGAKLGVAEPLREWLRTDWDRAVSFLHDADRLFHDPSRALRETSEAAMRATGRAVTARDFLTCHAFDARGELAAIERPVLALTGVHDTLTPPRFHGYLARTVPDGRAALVPEAAHLSMLEAPSAVNTLLRAFIPRDEG